MLFQLCSSPKLKKICTWASSCLSRRHLIYTQGRLQLLLRPKLMSRQNGTRQNGTKPLIFYNTSKVVNLEANANKALNLNSMFVNLNNMPCVLPQLTYMLLIETIPLLLFFCSHNLAEKVDECPLIRVVEYCLRTLGTVKTVHYME